LWLNSYSAAFRLMTSCNSAITFPKSNLRVRSDVAFISRLSIYMSLMLPFFETISTISEQHLLIFETFINMHFPRSMSLTLNSICLSWVRKIYFMFSSYCIISFVTASFIDFLTPSWLVLVYLIFSLFFCW